MKLIDDLKSKDVKLPADKSFTTYAVLAILFGAYGVHNFWAGNEEKAKAQLITGVVGLLCCCILPLVSYVTAIMDVITVKNSLEQKA